MSVRYKHVLTRCDNIVFAILASVPVSKTKLSIKAQVSVGSTANVSVNENGVKDESDGPMKNELKKTMMAE